MKKKIITTATTTILALGLLQGASTAYAANLFSQRIGGVGDGVVSSLNEDGVTVDSIVGTMVIKLNGVLSNGLNGSYVGEGFFTAALGPIDALGGPLPPIREEFTFNCAANAVGDTEHEVAIGKCEYNFEQPQRFVLTSDGECYITKDDHHREMACNFMYNFFEQPVADEALTLVAVAPVSFPIIF